MAVNTNGLYKAIGEHAPDRYLQTWTRDNLPDHEHFYLTDIDLVLRNREGKLMIVEIKRRNAEMNTHQRTTYELIDVLIRQGIKIAYRGLKLESMKYPVHVDYKGFHLLQFENTTFENGKIFWNHKEVTVEEIKQILSFEAAGVFYK